MRAKVPRVREVIGLLVAELNSLTRILFVMVVRFWGQNLKHLISFHWLPPYG